MTTISKYVLTISILLMVSIAVVGGNVSNFLLDNDGINQNHAIELAKEYLGIQKDTIPRMENLSEIKTELITINDTITPFISDQIDGKRAWEITFDSVVFVLARAKEEFQRKYPKKIIVEIDSLTGQLIEIIIKDISKETPESFCLIPDSAELKMRKYEEYMGLPNIKPTFSLAHALNKVHGSPIHTHTIRANYFLYKRIGKEVKPIWDIYLYGMIPIPLFDENEIENVRNVLDATTGYFMFVTNRPH